jgi:hypothetical protein
MAEEFVWLAAGLVTFAAGLAMGAWLSRADRGARARIVELETEVEQLAARLTAERDAVAKHFDQTSDLFRDLTRDYTALYAHLAEGARDLCPDRIPEIGRGLGEPPGLEAGGLEAGLTGDGPRIASSETRSELEGASPSSDDRQAIGGA